MSKRNPKKYTGYSILFKSKCINTDNCSYLYEKWYDIIDEDSTKYLVRFNSGAAHWYDKTRFKGIYNQ